MPLATPDLPQAEAAIVEMTNAFRVEKNLGAVTSNAALHMAAQAFADYLAKSGSFAHTADGRQPSERAKAAGYHYCIVAENLALHHSDRGYETTDLAYRAVDGWKNSPAHRANMLLPYVTETGIGIAKADGAEQKFFTVQLFGRPEALKYTIEIENVAGAAVTYVLGDQTNTISTSMHVTHSDCVPRELAFNLGRVTSKFEVSSRDVFVISRDSEGGMRVEREHPHDAAAAPPAAAALIAAKTVRPAR